MVSCFFWYILFFNFLSNIFFILFPNMNITPFSRSQLICIMIISPISYLFLGPLHELGHYHKAVEIAASQNYNVSFYLNSLVTMMNLSILFSTNGFEKIFHNNIHIRLDLILYNVGKYQTGNPIDFLKN